MEKDKVQRIVRMRDSCLGQMKNVLQFWELRTADLQYGGYHTEFDRFGVVCSTEKNIWMQARQTWMFSTVYRRWERAPKWLELAKQGRDYLVSHAYAGAGRWNYLLDLDGRILKGAESIFTDLFVLMGLAEYAKASGSTQDLKVMQETFDSLWVNVQNDKFEQIYPQTYIPGCVVHSLYMICINAVAEAAPVLQDARCEKLIRYCLDKIFLVFADRKEKIIYEIKKTDGTFMDTESGNQINPGHIFESMWFAVQQSERLGIKEYRTEAFQIIRQIQKLSFDRKCGGVYYMLDARCKTPLYKDWNHSRDIQWNEKVWWTHAEAMYASLLLAADSGSEEALDRFEQLFDWSIGHFNDTEYGEWYCVLDRLGNPRITRKGGYQKAAFHIPRALLNCWELLNKMIKSEDVFSGTT